MVEPVGRSPYVFHVFHDACQKLLLDRLQLFTLFTIYVIDCFQFAFSQSRCPRCVVQPDHSSPLVSHVGYDACHNLSLVRLQLYTVSTMLVRTCRSIAFIQSRYPRYLLETIARSPLVIHIGHDACQNLSLDRLQLVTVATIHATHCRQIAFGQSQWPRCLVETVATSPLVNHVVLDACQKLPLNQLYLVTMATVLVGICRQFAFIIHGGHDAFYKLSPVRLQLFTVTTMHVRYWHLIAFFSHSDYDAWQKLSLDRVQLVTVSTLRSTTVAWSPLVSHGGHDACQKLSVVRLQLVTVATMHATHCRQIAFSQSRWPRCMVETVAISPLVSHETHPFFSSRQFHPNRRSCKANFLEKFSSAWRNTFLPVTLSQFFRKDMLFLVC